MSIFKTKKKESSILDCLTYDLKTFFYDDYKEIDSEETPATVMMVYEKELPWKEFKIFNTVQFRIFFDKDKITGINPVNVKFLSKELISDQIYLKELTEKVLSIYGADDFKKSKWDKEDEKHYKQGNFRRVWTINKGDSFISIEFNNTTGISLNILFFNNMVKDSEVNKP